MIGAFFKLLGIALFVVIASVLAIAFGMWILGAFACFLAIFVLAWAVGIPITIKENGVKIGYVRWTKFYPTK